jgi:hypothetical protein
MGLIILTFECNVLSSILGWLNTSHREALLILFLYEMFESKFFHILLLFWIGKALSITDFSLFFDLAGDVLVYDPERATDDDSILS